VIISSDIQEDFSAFDVTVIERAFAAADLDGAALVFVAEEGPDAEAAKLVARQKGIPLNVVDVPDECDFYTPSIIDRAPLTVAISSEGDAPVLARLVRARIEAMLSPQIGAIARLAGSMRGRVTALLSRGEDRRRYYEDLVTAASVEKALLSSQVVALSEAERLLDQHARRESAAGLVTLIGAGPGAEDLLTLRAQRVLQECDVIVHDQLVPDAVVDMARRDATRICVGKAKGHHSFSQAQINTLLVRLAREGKRVARLKSGDPMIFGRAGEEIAALRKAGIAYSIVPGISAAMAAAADTATPVTLRKVSSGFIVATAHGADDGDLAHWASLAASGLTLALYMGKSIASEVAARLIGHGAKPATPVGIVVNAGRADRSFYRGTLAGLAGGEVEFAEGPAVILVGDAIASGDWQEAVAFAERSVQVA
jgi:uroporphyrin-III C-methyltransferase/precorrin-2 dehydrogenase/sirohydrochlorin ferrochelatase